MPDLIITAHEYRCSPGYYTRAAGRDRRVLVYEGDRLAMAIGCLRLAPEPGTCMTCGAAAEATDLFYCPTCFDALPEACGPRQYVVTGEDARVGGPLDEGD